jgi:hypothetical protein
MIYSIVRLIVIIREQCVFVRRRMLGYRYCLTIDNPHNIAH